MKTCTKCKISKPKEEFNLHSITKDGLRCSCRECQGEEKKIYYQKNKEQITKQRPIQSKLIRIRNNEYVNKIKGDHGCKYCKEKDPCCLDFHHISNKVKQICRLVNGDASIKTIQKEIDKCEVVCANCHQKMHS